MNIQRRKVKLDVEKSLLTGAVTSTQFLKDTYTVLKENYFYFKSSYIRLVLGWIFVYFEENGKAPEMSIQDIYNIRSGELTKDADAEIVEDLLLDISEKFESMEEFDSDYWSKQCITYCKKMSILNLASELRGLAESNDVKRAEYLAGEYKRVETGISNGIDVDAPETDERRDKIYSKENSLSVIRFPGAFGQLMGKLERGGLYLISSNSKKGKSFLAIDMAKYCKMQGLNVHYYSLEMSADKLIERYDMSISKSLVFVDENDDVGDEYYSYSSSFIKKKVSIPRFDDDNTLYTEQMEASSVTAERAKKANKLFKKQYRAGKLYYYDITSAGNTLEAIIRNEDMEEQYNGNVASVVIIDSIYNCADYMNMEKRHRWEKMHWVAKQELGERRGKVVITPFQMNREALKSNNPDETNLAEAYGVFHHASASLFLSSTKEEARKGLIKCQANGRDNNYQQGSSVILTRCLDIASGWIDSRWEKDIPNYKEFLSEEDSITEADESELENISLDQV
jgi:KaiC/GvpD/RAD55 family RecA-like ATPase